jgi:hypothetical protein
LRSGKFQQFLIWRPESRTCYASADSSEGNSIAGWGIATSGDFSKGKAGAIDIEGFFDQLLDEIGTGGVFAPGDRRMALLFKEYPQSLGAS